MMINAHILPGREVYGDDCHTGGTITRVREVPGVGKLAGMMVLNEFTVEWKSGMICTYPADMLAIQDNELRVIG